MTVLREREQKRGGERRLAIRRRLFRAAKRPQRLPDYQLSRHRRDDERRAGGMFGGGTASQRALREVFFVNNLRGADPRNFFLVVRKTGRTGGLARGSGATETNAGAGADGSGGRTMLQQLDDFDVALRRRPFEGVCPR